MRISVSETWKDAINPIYHGGHPSQKTKKYMAPKIKHIMTKSERVDDFNEIAQGGTDRKTQSPLVGPD